MGFELLYRYHERLEAGGYNKDETKELKRKLGDAYEEVPLEKVASAVMQQLARRDIWVVDVEIAEYTRRKVTFRETTGGIVIKNKKFLLDQSGVGGIVSQDLNEAPPQPQPTQYPHQNLQPQRYLPATVQPRARPKKKVEFMPSRMDLARVAMAKAGARLTVEKEYDVLAEFPSTGVGMMFRLVDDSGREVEMSDEFFVPVQINLIADRELGFSKSSKKEQDLLNWQGAYQEQVPDIRGGR